MNNGLLFLITVLLVMAGFGCEGPRAVRPTPPQLSTEIRPIRDSTNQAAPNSEKLLLLPDENPLPQASSQSLAEIGQMADNSRCQVCHLNLAEEELVVTHVKAHLGCADCHGQSDAHIADESWASGGNGTAPDIMYDRAKINPFCLTCHPKERIDNDAHREMRLGTAEEKSCTDCHGKHRLAKRKCHWK